MYMPIQILREYFNKFCNSAFMSVTGESCVDETHVWYRVINYRPSTSAISMSKCPIVMFICVFLCPECSCIFFCTVVLSCYVVILVLYLTLPLRGEVWLAAKPGSTHHFFF